MHRSDMAALQMKHVVLSQAVSEVVGGMVAGPVERSLRDELRDLKKENAQLSTRIKALIGLSDQLTAILQEHVSGSLKSARQLRKLTDAHYANIHTVADQGMSWWAKSEKVAATSSSAVELIDSV